MEQYTYYKLADFSERIIKEFPENNYAGYKYPETSLDFFRRFVSFPLKTLLKKNEDIPKIKKYCAVIEDMFAAGDEFYSVVDYIIMYISGILDSDDEIMMRFGEHISDDFKFYLNENEFAHYKINSDFSDRPHKLSVKETAGIFTAEFPEAKEYYDEHLCDYGEIVGHIFFMEMINIPLFELLQKNTESDLIKKYCDFIEKMKSDGNRCVENIVVVTILERLSDDENVWVNFGKYISNDFIRYINTEAIPGNIAMNCIGKLEYNHSQRH